MAWGFWVRTTTEDFDCGASFQKIHWPRFTPMRLPSLLREYKLASLTWNFKSVASLSDLFNSSLSDQFN